MMGSYDILKDISEHVTLLNLMNYLGNINHAISVVGYWIFDSNYKRLLVLSRESLDVICAPSVSESKSLSLKQYLLLWDTFDQQCT